LSLVGVGGALYIKEIVSILVQIEMEHLLLKAISVPRVGNSVAELKC
jgi:hypothetical protein